MNYFDYIAELETYKPVDDAISHLQRGILLTEQLTMSCPITELAVKLKYLNNQLKILNVPELPYNVYVAIYQLKKVLKQYKTIKIHGCPESYFSNNDWQHLMQNSYNLKAANVSYYHYYQCSASLVMNQFMHCIKWDWCNHILTIKNGGARVNNDNGGVNNATINNNTRVNNNDISGRVNVYLGAMPLKSSWCNPISRDDLTVLKQMGVIGRAHV